jgi:hypothetical protein
MQYQGKITDGFWKGPVRRRNPIIKHPVKQVINSCLTGIR